MLGPDASGAVAALWGHLRDRIRWDVLLLRDLPRDGPTSALLEPLARADGHLCGRWESQRSPYVPLGGGAVEAGGGARFRANLRRRAGGSREMGAVALRREDAERRFEGVFQEFLALEASGWKGRRGTAIARSERWWASTGAGSGRRPAAVPSPSGPSPSTGVPWPCTSGWCTARRYYLPKTAYDEALGSVSPGQLLHGEVLAECRARGLEELDFLGPDMEWKRDWGPEHRPHDWLYLYRPSLAGRALHAIEAPVATDGEGGAPWWR